MGSTTWKQLGQPPRVRFKLKYCGLVRTTSSIAASTRLRKVCDCMLQFSFHWPAGRGQLPPPGAGAGSFGAGLLGAGLLGAGLAGTGVTVGTGMTITGAIGACGTVTGATGVSCGSSSVIVWQATTVRPTSMADTCQACLHRYPLDWT